MKRAESVSTVAQTGKEISTFAVSEEIEASAECIVLCAMCLEAYIKGFAQDHLQSFWTEDMERMEVRVKWLVIPAMLGKADCFQRGSQPYQDFAKLIRWRNNDLAHYKHDFQSPAEIVGIGRVSKIYTICSAANAQRAIETLRQMIQRINEELGFAVPNWLHNEGAWIHPPIIDLSKGEIGYAGPFQ